MASSLELVGEALVTYWTSPLSLGVLLACGTAMTTLLYVFVTNTRNAKLRVSLLTGLYALSLFLWAFIGVSLFLCVSQARMVAYTSRGVPLAVSGAVVGGLAASAVISLLVWRYGNAAVLRKFAPRSPRTEEQWLQAYANLVAEFEGISPVRVGIVESDDAIALAVGGRTPHVLVSGGLLRILEKEEVETVIAHELMHLKHHDAGFKVFSRVFSRILFFDPFSKFFDPAVQREREYLADEMGARSTGKPAALASALVKIADRGVPPRSAWGLSILGLGRGLFSRYPPLKERVQRLLVLSDLMTISTGNLEKP